MKIIIITLLIILFLSCLCFSQNKIGRLEKDVISEINLVRTNPKKYEQFLKEQKKYYHDKEVRIPGKIILLTDEGVEALDEAIHFLHKVDSIPSLTLSPGLSRAAKVHMLDCYKNGLMGHVGSDKSQVWDRIERYGTWSKKIGEVISYGEETARDIVIQLIIDDGVQSRGHRKNIFDSTFKFAGVSFGNHPKYKYQCVIDFAGGFKEK